MFYNWTLQCIIFVYWTCVKGDFGLGQVDRNIFYKGKMQLFAKYLWIWDKTENK